MISLPIFQDSVLFPAFGAGRIDAKLFKMLFQAGYSQGVYFRREILSGLFGILVNNFPEFRIGKFFDIPDNFFKRNLLLHTLLLLQNMGED